MNGQRLLDPSAESRVIMHLDLDCFYAQVERRRLGLPPDTAVPVIAMSWAGAIAISYPARIAGVSRFDSTDAVRQRCPEARVCFIETIEEGMPAHTGGEDPVKAQTDQRYTKLCLLRYRRASNEVFDAISQWI